MVTNSQGFVRSGVIKIENYLFFQTTPFLCLLNVKQTKIRGDFIFSACKFNNSKSVKPRSIDRVETECREAGFRQRLIDPGGKSKGLIVSQILNEATVSSEKGIRRATMLDARRQRRGY
jgi:hypothetical protein